MKESHRGDPVFSHLSNEDLCTPSREWQPILNKPTYQVTKGIQTSDECVTVVYAWYDGIDNELVSSLNRSYSPDMWSRESANSFNHIKIANTSIEVTKLASPSGKTRFVTKWFVINEKIFSSDLKAKLYQIYLVFLGQPVSGSLIFVSSENQEYVPEAISTLYH
jgi:EpsI family protein